MTISRKLKQKLATGAVACVAVVSLSWGGYWWWLHTPPAIPQTADEALAAFSSPRFERLPQQRKQAYYEQARKIMDDMPEEERRELGKKVREDPQLRKVAQDVMMNQITSRAREFAMATPFERQQILDKMIGMMQIAQSRRRERANDPSRSGSRGSGDRPQRTPEEQAQRDADRAERRERHRQWMQDQVEQGDPQRQAYVSEFVKALFERRAELGLDPMPVPQRRR